MNFNTNEKKQLTENTLVIGNEIAKKKHFAYAVDERGWVLQITYPFMY